jgi:hypothetical protein
MPAGTLTSLGVPLNGFPNKSELIKKAKPATITTAKTPRPARSEILGPV